MEEEKKIPNNNKTSEHKNVCDSSDTCDSAKHTRTLFKNRKTGVASKARLFNNSFKSAKHYDFASIYEKEIRVIENIARGGSWQWTIENNDFLGGDHQW